MSSREGSISPHHVTGGYQATSPNSAMGSFDSATSNNDMGSFDASFPNMIMAFEDIDGTPMAQALLNDPFMGNRAPWNRAESSAAGFASASGASASGASALGATASGAFAPTGHESAAGYDASHVQMNVSPSAFATEDSTSVVEPRNGSLQPETPNTQPQLLCGKSGDYWQGFDDGVRFRMQPMQPQEALPPVLDGNGLSNGATLAVTQFPNGVAVNGTGMVTAPANPFQREFNREVNGGVELTMDQKVNKLYTEVMPILVSLQDTVKVTEARITSLANMNQDSMKIIEARFNSLANALLHISDAVGAPGAQAGGQQGARNTQN